MEVKSFMDSTGNKVKIGDTVGFHASSGEQVATGEVSRIKKMGSYISVYCKDRMFPWYPHHLKKI